MAESIQDLVKRVGDAAMEEPLREYRENPEAFRSGDVPEGEEGEPDENTVGEQREIADRQRKRDEEGKFA